MSGRATAVAIQDGATVIDVPALRQALATLQAHRGLLIASYVDATGGGPESLRAARVRMADVLAAARTALAHVVDDDFRSNETRGGS